MSIAKCSKMPTGGISVVMIAMVCLAVTSLVAADISPNPYLVTRIIDVANETNIVGFANGGMLRKRGEGTLTLTAPSLNRAGEVVVEGGAAVLDMNAATTVPTLPAALQDSALVWLDATQNVVTNGESKVIDWFDHRETSPTSEAETHSHPFATSRIQQVPDVSGGEPTLVTDVAALNGKCYVDFGALGDYSTGKWLCMTNAPGSVWGLSQAVDVFVVFAKHPSASGVRGIGTMFSGYYDGNRCNPFWYSNASLVWGKLNSSRADKGSTWLDRSPIYSDFVPVDDLDWHLVVGRVAIVQQSLNRWNLLGADRDYNAGGMRIAELLTFDRRLSEFDRMRVEEYLWRKWKGSHQVSFGTVSVNTGASATIDNATEITGDLTGGGAVVKTGSGRLRTPALDFTGTVELRGGSVRSDGAAFAVASTGQCIMATASSVVSNYSRAAAGVVAKNGLGVLTVASLPAETSTLDVRNGTLKLAPPVRRGVPVAASFPNGDFEGFAPVADINNIGGGQGTSQAVESGKNWIFDRTGRTALNAVTLVNNSYNTGTFKLQVSDVDGSLGYDGAVALLLCQGKATGTFTLPAAGVYKVSFRIAGYGAKAFDAQILVDGNQVVEFTALDTRALLRYEAELPWLPAGNHTFTISDVQPTQTNRLNFDDVKILPVELRDEAPVSVAIQNPSFEQPWTNVATSYNDARFQPVSANCVGWTLQDSSHPWAGRGIRRRWYDWIPVSPPQGDDDGIASNPYEMPDGFLCAQLYGAFKAIQTVSIPSAGRYRLSFHLAKRNGMSPQTVLVKVGGAVVKKVRVRHDEFRRYEAVFDLAEGGDKELRFEGTDTTTDSTPHTAGGALLDAISMERVSASPPANLVSNGTFEAGATDWTLSGTAKLVSSSGANDWVGSFRRMPLQGLDGVLFNSAAAGVLRQDVTFPAAGRYELSFRCMTLDRYPYDLTKVSSFLVKVGDNCLLCRNMLDDVDEKERIVTLPFTVSEAGTQQLEFSVENVGSCKATVLIDDVSVVSKAMPDRTDLAQYIPHNMEVAVTSGAILSLDFDGVANVAGVRYNGTRYTGEISHATCPTWVMGRGRLNIVPRGVTIIFR